ncbi:MAG: ABC transporter substrate-binding protein [Firmicutes bacterium]|nr:ABC transporter substrate-binding protein [Bacillota bacterium]
MNKKFCMLLVIALGLALLFTGCASGNAPGAADPADASSDAAPDRDTSQVIVAVTADFSAGFDPVTGYGLRYDPILQSRLVKTWNGVITEDLATDYSVDDGGKTWRFQLRDDAFFSNGDQVKASDAAFTFNAAKGAGGNLDLTNMVSAEAEDDLTVKFTLEKPDYTFIYQVSKLGIVPEALYDENYMENPVGSGPYKMVQWDKGQQAIWEYNDLYYGGEPSIKRIILVFMDEDAAFAAAQKGDVDMIETNQSLATQTIDGYYLKNVETINNFGIIFCTVPDEGKTTEDGKKIGNNVTCDKAIRQAISLGIDREAMNAEVFNGYGHPSDSMCDLMPWFNEETALNDSNSGLDVACNILDEAGWVDNDGDGVREKDGVKAEFDLYYTSSNGNRQMVAMNVAEQAKALGISVVPKGAANSDIQELFHSEAYVFGRGDHTPVEFYLMSSTNSIGAGWSNSGYYSNPTVDEYFDKAMASDNLDDVYKYYKLAQWDGATGASHIGDAPDAWFVRPDNCFFIREGLDIGTQSLHPHGASLQVFNNILEWKWN